MPSIEPTGERVVLRLKPTWKSFVVYYVAAAVLVAVAVKELLAPHLGRPFPLSPALTLLLAAVVLGVVVLRRHSAEFIITTRRVKRLSALGFGKEIELARIDHLKTYQSLVQRLTGTGKIEVAKAGDFTSTIWLFGIEEPNAVRDTIAGLIGGLKP
ncbi:MAG: PH domain-containing protein [Pseudomonadota bacterium]